VTDELGTPFEATMHRRLSRASERLLLPMSIHLEHKALDAAEPAVLLACFQNAARFGDAAQSRFSRLAARAAFTAVVGRDMPSRPGPGIRGARLSPGDPIAEEWTLIVLGPHFAGALLAKECSPDGTPADRMFDFLITHDRDLVIAAARPLLKRVLADDHAGP
jgi:DICT domain-containing protein